MNNSQTIYDRYEVAMRVYAEGCAAEAEEWHRPDVVEFSELLRLLKPYAESGDMGCQYAVATILWRPHTDTPYLPIRHKA
jgi:hypothetical protein